MDMIDRINKKIINYWDEELIKDLGLNLVILDPLGGFENRQSYTQLIEYNVDSIIQALK